MLTAMSRLLRARGYQVLCYSNGDDFLHDEAEGRFDCACVDLHMTGKSGIDVLKALQHRPSHSPVIVITGHDSPGNESTVRSLGAASYLLKPVDKTTLFSALDAAIQTSASSRRTH